MAVVCLMLVQDAAFAMPDRKADALSPLSSFTPPRIERDEDGSVKVVFGKSDRFKEKTVFAYLSVLIGQYLKLGISEHTIKPDIGEVIRAIKEHVGVDGLSAARLNDPLLKGFLIDQSYYAEEENAYYLPVERAGLPPFSYKFHLVRKEDEEPDITIPLESGAPVYVSLTGITDEMKLALGQDADVSAHEMVAMAVAAVGNGLPADIFKVIQDGPDAQLAGNRAELFRAILNLVKNARDAVTDPGTGMPIDGAKVAIEIESRPTFVRISVSDTGPGFSQDAMDDFNESGALPATTKGEGHGLGVGIAREMILRNHGYMTLAHNEPGGAKAIMHLPVRGIEPYSPAFESIMEQSPHACEDTLERAQNYNPQHIPEQSISFLVHLILVYYGDDPRQDIARLSLRIERLEQAIGPEKTALLLGALQKATTTLYGPAGGKADIAAVPDFKALDEGQARQIVANMLARRDAHVRAASELRRAVLSMLTDRDDDAQRIARDLATYYRNRVTEFFDDLESRAKRLGIVAPLAGRAWVYSMEKELDDGRPSDADELTSIALDPEHIQGERIVVDEAELGVAQLREGEELFTDGLFDCAAFIARAKLTDGTYCYFLSHILVETDFHLTGLTIKNQMALIGQALLAEPITELEIYFDSMAVSKPELLDGAGKIQRALEADGVKVILDDSQSVWTDRPEIRRGTVAVSVDGITFEHEYRDRDHTAATITRTWGEGALHRSSTPTSPAGGLIIPPLPAAPVAPQEEARTFVVDPQASDYEQWLLFWKYLKALAYANGITTPDMESVETYATELFTNVYKRAAGGSIDVSVVTDRAGMSAVRLSARDHGPSIVDRSDPDRSNWTDPEILSQRARRTIPSRGKGFYYFSSGRAAVVVESAGEVWVKDGWGGFDRTDIGSDIVDGNRVTITFYHDARGDLVDTFGQACLAQSPPRTGQEPPLGMTGFAYRIFERLGFSPETAARFSFAIEEPVFSLVLLNLLPWFLAVIGFPDMVPYATIFLYAASNIRFGFSHDTVYTWHDGNVIGAGPATWRHKLGFMAMGMFFRGAYLIPFAGSWLGPVFAFAMHAAWNNYIAEKLGLPVGMAKKGKKHEPPAPKQRAYHNLYTCAEYILSLPAHDPRLKKATSDFLKYIEQNRAELGGILSKSEIARLRQGFEKQGFFGVSETNIRKLATVIVEKKPVGELVRERVGESRKTSINGQYDLISLSDADRAELVPVITYFGELGDVDTVQAEINYWRTALDDLENGVTLSRHLSPQEEDACTAAFYNLGSALEVLKAIYILINSLPDRDKEFLRKKANDICGPGVDEYWQVIEKIRQPGALAAEVDRRGAAFGSSLASYARFIAALAVLYGGRGFRKHIHDLRAQVRRKTGDDGLFRTIIPESSLFAGIEFTFVNFRKFGAFVVENEEYAGFHDAALKINPGTRVVGLSDALPLWARDRVAWIDTEFRHCIIAKSQTDMSIRQPQEAGLSEGGAVVPGKAVTPFVLVTEDMRRDNIEGIKEKARSLGIKVYVIPSGFNNCRHAKTGGIVRINHYHLDSDIGVVTPDLTVDGRAKLLVDPAYYRMAGRSSDFNRFLKEQGAAMDIVEVEEEDLELHLPNFAVILDKHGEKKILFNKARNRETLDALNIKPGVIFEPENEAARMSASGMGGARCLMNMFPKWLYSPPESFTVVVNPERMNAAVRNACAAYLSSPAAQELLSSVWIERVDVTSFPERASSEFMHNPSRSQLYINLGEDTGNDPDAAVAFVAGSAKTMHGRLAVKMGIDREWQGEPMEKLEAGEDAPVAAELHRLQDEVAEIEAALKNEFRACIERLGRGPVMVESLQGVLRPSEGRLFGLIGKLRSANTMIDLLKGDFGSYKAMHRNDSPDCGLCVHLTEILQEALEAAGHPTERQDAVRLGAGTNTRYHAYVVMQGAEGEIAIDAAAGQLIPEFTGHIAVEDARRYAPIITAAIEKWTAEEKDAGTQEEALKSAFDQKRAKLMREVTAAARAEMLEGEDVTGEVKKLFADRLGRGMSGAGALIDVMDRLHVRVLNRRVTSEDAAKNAGTSAEILARPVVSSLDYDDSTEPPVLRGAMVFCGVPIDNNAYRPLVHELTELDICSKIIASGADRGAFSERDVQRLANLSCTDTLVAAVLLRNARRYGLDQAEWFDTIFDLVLDSFRMSRHEDDVRAALTGTLLGPAFDGYLKEVRATFVRHPSILGYMESITASDRPDPAAVPVDGAEFMAVAQEMADATRALIAGLALFTSQPRAMLVSTDTVEESQDPLKPETHALPKLVHAASELKRIIDAGETAKRFDEYKDLVLRLLGDEDVVGRGLSELKTTKDRVISGLERTASPTVDPATTGVVGLLASLVLMRYVEETSQRYAAMDPSDAILEKMREVRRYGDRNLGDRREQDAVFCVLLRTLVSVRDIGSAQLKVSPDTLHQVSARLLRENLITPALIVDYNRRSYLADVSGRTITRRGAFDERSFEKLLKAMFPEIPPKRCPPLAKHMMAAYRAVIAYEVEAHLDNCLAGLFVMACRGWFVAEGMADGVAGLLKERLHAKDMLRLFDDIRRTTGERYPKKEGLTAAYFLSASDVTTPILATDAATIFLYDAMPFEAGRDEAGCLKWKASYISYKATMGFIQHEILEVIGNVKTPILWELGALGAQDIEITQESERVHRISFTLPDAPAGAPSRREIVYTQARFTSTDDLAAILADLRPDIVLKKADLRFGLPDGPVLPPVVVSFDGNVVPGFASYPIGTKYSGDGAGLILVDGDTYVDFTKATVYVRGPQDAAPAAPMAASAGGNAAAGLRERLEAIGQDAGIFSSPKEQAAYNRFVTQRLDAEGIVTLVAGGDVTAAALEKYLIRFDLQFNRKVNQAICDELNRPFERILPGSPAACLLTIFRDETLRTRPDLSVKEIMAKRLKDDDVTLFSLRTVYKEVEMLKRLGILVKGTRPHTYRLCPELRNLSPPRRGVLPLLIRDILMIRYNGITYLNRYSIPADILPALRDRVRSTLDSRWSGDFSGLPAANPYGAERFVERSFDERNATFHNDITDEIDRRLAASPDKPVTVLMIGIGRGFEAFGLMRRYGDRITLTAVDKTDMVYRTPKEVADRFLREGDALDPQEPARLLQRLRSRFFRADLDEGIPLSGPYDIVIMGCGVTSYVARKVPALETCLRLTADGGVFYGDLDLAFVETDGGVPTTVRDYLAARGVPGVGIAGEYALRIAKTPAFALPRLDEVRSESFENLGLSKQKTYYRPLPAAPDAAAETQASVSAEDAKEPAARAEELRQFIREGEVQADLLSPHDGFNVAVLYDMLLEEAGLMLRSIDDPYGIQVAVTHDPERVTRYRAAGGTLYYFRDKLHPDIGCYMLLNDRMEMVAYGTFSRFHGVVLFRYQVLPQFRSSALRYGTQALKLILHTLYREDGGCKTEAFFFGVYDDESFDPSQAMPALLRKNGFDELQYDHGSLFQFIMDEDVVIPNPVRFGSEGKWDDLSDLVRRADIRMIQLTDVIKLAVKHAPKGTHTILALGDGCIPEAMRGGVLNQDRKELYNTIDHLCRENGIVFVHDDEAHLLEAIADVKKRLGANAKVVVAANIHADAFEALYEASKKGEGDQGKTIDFLAAVTVVGRDFVCIPGVLASVMRLSQGKPLYPDADLEEMTMSTTERYPGLHILIPKAVQFPADEKEKIIHALLTAQANA